METAIRALRLLTMTAWVGGLTFFAFVVAPVAFGSLPNAHDAGLVVGGTLRILHRIGLADGALFLVATAWLWAKAKAMGKRRTELAVQIALTAVMLAVTAYSQFNILPAMERDRVQAGGEIEAAPLSEPARTDFERLHAMSEKLEGLVLFSGIVVVILLSRESRWRQTQ
jgi:Domain of unknown function (DUF4149)